jgi:hypothetical protein
MTESDIRVPVDKSLAGNDVFVAAVQDMVAGINVTGNERKLRRMLHGVERPSLAAERDQLRRALLDTLGQPFPNPSGVHGRSIFSERQV